MRVLVCGSRGWNHAKPIADRIRELPAGSVVIHGDARGADACAGYFADLRGLKVERWPADWQTHGRRAGIVRNLRMLDTKPDLVLAFWDGESPGTRHTIEEARRRGIPVEVVRS